MRDVLFVSTRTTTDFLVGGGDGGEDGRYLKQQR